MQDGTKSIPKIFANIFIAFIGAGVLGVPYAFKEAGVIEGAIILGFIGLVSTRAMLLLIDCKYKILGKQPYNYQKLASEPDEKPAKQSNGNVVDVEVKELKPKINAHHDLEFGDLGYHALGKSGIVLVDGLVVLSQVGFCCAYLIFISENLTNFLPRFSRNQYLFAMVFPLIILTNVRQLKNLSIFSLFADFANIFAYCVVFWFDFENFEKIGDDIHNYSAEGLPFFIGIAVYCYEGAGMILSLESSVAKECQSKFYGIFKLAMLVITLLYMTFGICGYLSFGENTKSIITLNLPNGKFPVIVKSCLMFSLFFTYPVMMFPVSRILEMRLFNDPKTADYYKSSVVRSSLVLLTLVIVLTIPSFSTLMALIGSSCCILLAFILPGLFHLRIFKGELTIYQKILDYFLILLGIVTGCLGTRDAVERLFSKDNTAEI
ncbi:amino acid transporter AVT3A-like [Dendronephthya gigantea]|uniref:amino acid transporter AVT3A-like n=1 Tax=Dendronephthya gigantea TaxID=151771 RepID=UPI001069F022|nr:amino acid transporter AVT3A-like [Dendronephthya gigantea]